MDKDNKKTTIIIKKKTTIIIKNKNKIRKTMITKATLKTIIII